MRSACGHDNALIRSGSPPAKGSVSGNDTNVFVSQLFKSVPCAIGERLDTLDCVDFAGDLGQHSRRVAASRSDLKHALSAFEL